MILECDRTSEFRPLSRARPVAAAAIVLSLAACGDISRFQTSAPAPAKRTATVNPQTPTAEREHERILASYGGVYDDARVQALVTKTVDRLVAASERPEQTYKVTVLNSGSVNAFALPTGQLYVTRGLVTLSNDTAELSSVLSHEMAHVIARHAAIRENQARKAAVVARVVSEMGADSESSAMALAKTKLSLASFSRAQEFEADGIGVGIASRAGYDPFGSVRFLSAMERNGGLKPRGSTDYHSLDFLSSHPATPDRVQNARANARKFSTPSAAERDREVYLEAIDGMVYGEDPSEGFVRGRRFIHPKLGFTFTAPDGFALDNTAQAVIGVRENGTQAMRFDVVRVPAEQPLTDYLASGWMEGVEKDSIEETAINGFPGATASAIGDQWRFRVFAFRFGSDVYRFIFASKSKSSETDRTFRATVHSFRRLSLNESEAARPLHIKVITVQPGDTAESLAQRMAVAERHVDHFRVLNGLDAHEAVKVRERVKIVIE